MSPRITLLATALVVAAPVFHAAAQTTGQIVGVVIDSANGERLAGVEVRARQGEATGRSILTTTNGQFVIAGLAPGVWRVSARRIGYREWDLSQIEVRSGLTVRLRVVMLTQAQQLAAIDVVAVAPKPLLTPDVTSGRQVVTRDELRSTPIVSIEQVLELRTGVSDGHFRGGRLGQETYVIDGIDAKDQFSASRNGAAFQLAPSAVQEISVLTSGFTADQGSAVSGVVNLVTRSGPQDRWIGRLELVSDELTPASIRRGHNRGGVSAGGPLPVLPTGSTLFLDLSLFGEADQDPRVKGLSCLPVDFPCPATRTIIPHQRGDRYFAFGRVDIPISGGLDVAMALHRNRDQHELYSTRFKYALTDYLAERQTATLGSLAIHGALQPSSSQAVRLTARAAFGRIDRHLGVPEPDQRLGRFMLGDLRFRGEDYVHLPAADQVASGRGIPGYQAPSDSGVGNPYGIFGSDLFVSDGTSGIAEWSRSDFADFKGEAQIVVSPRHDLKIGGNVKLHHIQAYQHVAAGLAGAAPGFVEFYPRSVAAYLHNTLHALDAATIDLGIRLDAFQPRLSAPTNRRNLSAPVATTEWKMLVAPRIGFALPLAVIGVDRAALHWNFGLFSQPPDFQYFFDQALDDSLNTAVRRQGNPTLGFERAIQYEGGIEYLITDDFVFKASAFLKDLSGLTTSAIAVAGQPGLFSNFDFGRVEGGEARLEARLPGGRRVELGYSLQRAFGVVSTAFDSTVGPPGTSRIEVPLQFDRRHAIDVNALWSLPAGVWVATGGSAASGLPIPGTANERLPWSFNLAARLTRSFRIGGTMLQVMAEGRNILNRPNLVTARAGGGILPDVTSIGSRAAVETSGNAPIPRESPFYVAAFDTNENFFLDPAEQTATRRAALLDFYEPTLLYGEARMLRIGVEWSF